MPTLSVIVPTYNAAGYIEGCIRNIRAQSMAVTQLIVVDDGSTDSTHEVIESLAAITYVRQDNRGPSAARNRGLQEAAGDLVAFLDVDDLWPREALRTLAGSMDSSTDVVLGKVQCMIQPEGKPLDFEPFGDPFVAFNIGAALYRREVFDKVGPFDESLIEGEDVDWFLRAREGGVRIKNIDQTTLMYRRREGSITYGRQQGSETLAKMLKRSLDRRRSAGIGAAVPVDRRSSNGEDEV